jgi:hypothetical protein
MEACEFDWSLFSNVMSGAGSVVAAVFTIFLFYLARKELKKNNLIAEGDLYFRIKQDFDTEFSKEIYSSILHNEIKFCLDINPTCVKISKDKSYTSAYFFQAFLGSFEDLAFFHEKGLMSFEVLDSGYGYMVLETGNNNAVVSSIQFLRQSKGGDINIFIGFETLYKKLRATLGEEAKKKYRADFGPESPS